MNPCPNCQAQDQQVKAGKNASGSQRWKCQRCGRKYTPEPHEHGYPDTLRQQAVKMSVDGLNYRRIGRLLGVDHKTVIHWVKAHTDQLPPASVPDDLNNAELDELFTYVEQKKKVVYLMTVVDRRTSCIVGWAVASERTEAHMQRLVDDAPQAAFYFSDLFPLYRCLVYTPGIHTPMPDKSETYRVEGVNAELRHYLARWARQSRCFSRCIDALRRAVKLFVFAWNRRQLYRSRFPRYPAHLIDFAYP